MAQLIGECAFLPPSVSHADSKLVWTGLCDAGLGCSLQHYHKWLGGSLNEFAKVPAEWKGSAQLVFGTPTGPPRGGYEKEFAPLAPRVKSLGGNLK